MLIIQEIITKWSKQSRGGIHAAQRSKITATYPFTAVPVHTKEPFYFYQKVVFEEPGFVHPETQTMQLALIDDIQIGCINIRSVNNYFEVAYTYDMNCGGAPQRYDSPQQAFAIHQNEWGQLLYNGRFPNEHTWTYRQHTCNIGLLDPMQQNAFTQLIPTHRQDRRVHLR